MTFCCQSLARVNIYFATEWVKNEGRMTIVTSTSFKLLWFDKLCEVEGKSRQMGERITREEGMEDQKWIVTLYASA